MRQATDYFGNCNLQNVVLLASTTTAAGAVNTTGTAVSGLGEWKALILQLDVTAAATATADTLDVTVQTTIDGTNWIDIYHFTQILGDGGVKRYFGKLVWDASMSEFENGTALGAAAGRAIVGDQYRVKYVQADATTQNASFTFSVRANVIS